MRQTIRLTESELRDMISESVRRVLNEVAGYEDTINKANRSFDNRTLRGKITRALNPKKAKQFDRIQSNARDAYYSAKNDESDNRNYNYPNASDPYAVPSPEDRKRTDRNNAVMNKYRLASQH